jgi:hypothetical protein
MDIQALVGTLQEKASSNLKKLRLIYEDFSFDQAQVYIPIKFL